MESFSYVFQLVGGAKSITREEMRSFKKVWAEFANPRTGYLEKQQLVRFLSVCNYQLSLIWFNSQLLWQRLGGVFEVRIYPIELGVKNLMNISQANAEFDHSFRSLTVEGVDVARLTNALSSMDNARIRRRKLVYSRLYHEALISQEPGKGISFTNMLLMLAHHKLIDDREALM